MNEKYNYMGKNDKVKNHFKIYYNYDNFSHHCITKNINKQASIRESLYK